MCSKIGVIWFDVSYGLVYMWHDVLQTCCVYPNFSHRVLFWRFVFRTLIVRPYFTCTWPGHVCQTKLDNVWGRLFLLIYLKFGLIFLF